MTPGGAAAATVVLPEVPALGGLFARGAGLSLARRVRSGPTVLPDVEYVVRGVQASSEHVTEYQHLLGESASDALPAGFVHVLAFPVATGTTWADQVRHRIIDPLGLDDTYVPGTPGTGARPPVVPGYFDVDGDGRQENIETGRPWPAQDTSEGAAGAVVSTAADLATFGDALFRGRLLDDSALAAMTAEGPHHPRNSNYGLGLEIQRPDYRTTVWGHGGFLPGFRSALRYLPDRDLLVVVLVNDSRANADDLVELAYRSVTGSGTS